MTNPDASGVELLLVEFSRTSGFAGMTTTSSSTGMETQKLPGKDYTIWITLPEETVSTIEQLLAEAGIV